ncbi:MAG: hypothetical protein IPG87_07920 [Saprospiraceae bacterium]|nr:hypothetical protein [Candidatus Vicinibacter affinis]
MKQYFVLFSILLCNFSAFSSSIEVVLDFQNLDQEIELPYYVPFDFILKNSQIIKGTESEYEFKIIDRTEEKTTECKLMVTPDGPNYRIFVNKADALKENRFYSFLLIRKSDKITEIELNSVKEHLNNIGVVDLIFIPEFFKSLKAEEFSSDFATKALNKMLPDLLSNSIQKFNKNFDIGSKANLIKTNAGELANLFGTIGNIFDEKCSNESDGVKLNDNDEIHKLIKMIKNCKYVKKAECNSFIDHYNKFKNSLHEKVNVILTNNVIVIKTIGTFSNVYTERVGKRIISSFGIGCGFDFRENNNHEYGLFYGSVGAHFPISKSVSPNFPIKLTHKKCERFTVYVGTTILSGDSYLNNGKRKGILNTNNSLDIGFGYILFDGIFLSISGNMFNRKSDHPLISKQTFGIMPAISCTFDLVLRDTINKSYNKIKSSTASKAVEN